MLPIASCCRYESYSIFTHTSINYTFLNSVTISHVYIPIFLINYNSCMFSTSLPWINSALISHFYTKDTQYIQYIQGPRFLFPPQASWLVSIRTTRHKMTQDIVLFSSMLYASVFTCAVTAMVPSRFKLGCSLIFKLGLHRLLLSECSKWRLLFGDWEWDWKLRWNRIKTGCHRNVKIANEKVVRYKIGMLCKTGSFGTCSCSQSRRWEYVASASSQLYSTLPQL